MEREHDCKWALPTTVSEHFRGIQYYVFIVQTLTNATAGYHRYGYMYIHVLGSSTGEWEVRLIIMSHSTSVYLYMYNVSNITLMYTYLNNLTTTRANSWLCVYMYDRMSTDYTWSLYYDLWFFYGWYNITLSVKDCSNYPDSRNINIKLRKN